MTRKTPPAMGYNVRSALERFETDPNLFLKAVARIPHILREGTLIGKPDAESIRAIAKEIRKKIKKCVCLPKNEYQNLLLEIKQMAFAHSQESAALQMEPIDDEETRSAWVRSLTPSSGAQEILEKQWASSSTLIANQFRRKCSACFNGKCPKRKRPAKQKPKKCN
jgi:hypothetical protein